MLTMPSIYLSSFCRKVLSYAHLFLTLYIINISIFVINIITFISTFGLLDCLLMLRDRSFRTNARHHSFPNMETTDARGTGG